uniref:Nuclear factor interleukin-3-regulated protein-like n=1 Tax=Cynoglossus semilaevis TaxID=244447 RepID=A0A3P8VSY8_CYNSE
YFRPVPVPSPTLVPALVLVRPMFLPVVGAGPFSDEATSILSSTSQLARTLLGHSFVLQRRDKPSNSEAKSGRSADEESSSNISSRKREFMPIEKKDECYWDKRRKNNEAAKRSRERRRANDMVLEGRVLSLLEENARLRAELLALKLRYGLVKDSSNVSILPLSVPPAPPVVSHSVSEESCVSTSCSSNLGSPVFFEDTSSELGPSPGELVEEQVGNQSHMCLLEFNEAQCITKHQTREGLRNLPHKLRFKGPSSCSDGGETPPTSADRHSEPPVATDMSLRSQVSCLSQEVAQLKRLFSQQLFSKAVHYGHFQRLGREPKSL